MPWLIFILAFVIRLFSVWPDNTIVGFDQARDFFQALQITRGDLKIIGPVAGNNSSLHHGVAWLYFIALPILVGKGNPIWIVLWNSVFNALSAVAIYLLAQNMFNKRAAIISALVAAFSYYFVSYSGWLSNPTLTLFTVPLFFYGLWQYYRGKSAGWRTWGLPLCFLFLGLSIQLELFFIYLIPTFVIAWLILRPKFPGLKTSAYCLVTLFLSLSTMIATEIKFNFAGVKSLLSAGQLVGGSGTNISQFINRFADTFAQNLVPGSFILLLVLLLKIKGHKNLQFLLIYLLSPALMLFLGYHSAPWFLIGLPPAICLLTGYVLSLIPLGGIIPIVIFICFFNLRGNKLTLLEPDKAALLTKQIQVMNYTYQNSKGQPFAINTVTNPLYINAVWAWNYRWYSQKYGFLPSFAGGDQLPPYNVLPKSDGQEKIFYLIIDQTPRIPPIYTANAQNWAKENGKLVEEKDFDGIKVEKYQTSY